MSISRAVVLKCIYAKIEGTGESVHASTLSHKFLSYLKLISVLMTFQYDVAQILKEYLIKTNS